MHTDIHRLHPTGSAALLDSIITGTSTADRNPALHSNDNAMRIKGTRETIHRLSRWFHSATRTPEVLLDDSDVWFFLWNQRIHTCESEKS